MRSTKRYTKPNSTWLVWLLSIVLSLSTCIHASTQAAYDNNAIQTSKPASSVNLDVVEQACKLIYEGKFDDAGGLLENVPMQLNTPPAELLKIVNEYQAIDKQRQEDRKATYEETIAELQKLQAKTDANDIHDVNDVNGIDDVNDVNDIIERLSVITRAIEFADSKQEQQLLTDPFVKEVLQKSINKAAQMEVEGKWLDAYTSCYRWLVAIDPNNEAYEDYAQQLLDRASIAISFEDSPCETSEERYQGVDERIFLRAVNFMAAYYVRMLEYDQMATKGLERCKLLSEVMEKLPESDSEIENGESSKPTEYIRDSKKLAAWNVVLNALMEQVKSSLNEPAGFDKDKFVYIFEKVLELNEATVKFPRAVLISQFVEAALTALDPYTSLVWPRQVEDFEKIMTNEFTGIGIEISRLEGQLTVASLLPDTPAYKSGLDAGDIIEKVNGIETKDMTLTCAVHKITGPKGTEVSLSIKRPNEDKKWEIKITRDKIVVPTIRGWQRTETGRWLYTIDEKNNIGYIRLTSFSSETASDLEKALLKLEADGLKGLILDLRFNTGGLLDSAVEVADKFIDADDWVVKRQPRAGITPTYEPSHRKGTHPNYPLVILVNSSSASASEIVAGALADKKYKRTILVGGRTHGKGSVQGVTSYPGDGSQLKYTMAYYHLPSDQRVESQEAMKKLGRTDWGIGPNVNMVLRSNELKKMIEMQRDNDVLARADHDNTNGDLKKHTIEETLASDPQLAVGLLVVRSKLIEAEALVRTWLNL
jgi:carboxyl-terminal processing protease